MVSRKVVLSDLPDAEKERFLEFLVANKVVFAKDEERSTYLATIRVVPPEPTNARLTDRAKKAQKQSIRRANSRGKKPRPRSAGPTPSQDPVATLKSAQSLLRKRYGRFCNLLPHLSQPPKAVRKGGLLRFAEEVYDARYEKDSQYIKSEAAGEAITKIPQSFPDFIFEFASKRYGLKSLVGLNCWGMVSSVELLRGQHVGVDIFGKFVDETYDATDLLFFLFTRSAIGKVVNAPNAGHATEAEKDGEKEDSSRGDGGAKDKTGGEDKRKSKVKAEVGGPAGVKSVTAPGQDVRMTLNQVVQVVKMSIDTKRQDLREQVIKKLDLAMAARTEGAARKAPTLEPERLLAIATEEYHNSRDLTLEMKLGDSLRSTMVAELSNNADGSIPKEKDLSPDVRKEVRQVTQRLMQSLAENGETDANPQQVYEWALQVVLRREKIEDVLDPLRGYEPGSPAAQDSPPQLKPSLDQIVPASAILKKTPVEFEQDLEANVRWLLLDATTVIVARVVATALDKEWQEKEAAASMKSALISEFAPMADSLMESIVGRDFQAWLDTMKVPGQASITMKDQFDKMGDDFEAMLSSEVNPEAVQRMCKNVVSADDTFANLIKERALELTKIGKSKKLGESSSEEEGEL